MTNIKLSNSEIQSGWNRVTFAEGLISQLPKNHDGRNTWLLNYGVGKESRELREKCNKDRADRGYLPLDFILETECLESVY
jgi:hypothetical protein